MKANAHYENILDIELETPDLTPMCSTDSSDKTDNAFSRKGFTKKIEKHTRHLLIMTRNVMMNAFPMH